MFFCLVMSNVFLFSHETEGHCISLISLADARIFFLHTALNVISHIQTMSRLFVATVVCLKSQVGDSAARVCRLPSALRGIDVF
jgi:hypothetical protein